MDIVARWVAEERMYGTDYVVRGGHWVAQVLGPKGEVLGEGYASMLENAVYFARKDAEAVK